MNKSDSAHPADENICIQQGDWEAYRNHIDSRAGQGEPPRPSIDESEEELRELLPVGDSSGQLLNGEEDILAYRRQCARAYIGMNGRLGGRAYRANAPVILTPGAVQELAELNRLLREERAQKKKQG